MKIAICSDLHLELGDLDIHNDQNADVLVLAGDIFEAHTLYEYPEGSNANHVEVLANTRRAKAKEFRAFIKRASERFEHVIAIAGNHEFYRGRWHASLDVLTKEYEAYPNVCFLENRNVVIDGIRFVGGTLWTDLGKSVLLENHPIMQHMNDYRMIVNDARGYARLTAKDTVRRHHQTMRYFGECTDQYSNEKIVIISHMAPSSKSIHEDYKRTEHDLTMNVGYYSDLSEFILERPQIKLWIHGHTHHEWDYRIGDCRVVCNPRGYVGYERKSQDVEPYYPKIVEVN